jgi:hypothetical protein
MVPIPVKHSMDPHVSFNYPRLYPEPSTIPISIKQVLANNSLLSDMSPPRLLLNVLA